MYKNNEKKRKKRKWLHSACPAESRLLAALRSQTDLNWFFIYTLSKPKSTLYPANMASKWGVSIVYCVNTSIQWSGQKIKQNLAKHCYKTLDRFFCKDQKEHTNSFYRWNPLFVLCVYCVYVVLALFHIEEITFYSAFKPYCQTFI